MARTAVWRLGAATLFGMLGLAAVGAAGTGTAGAATGAATSVLNGTASPAAGRTPSVGAVAAGSKVDFEVSLNLRDAAGAQALAQSVSTPGSAQYHQYLTPAEWEAQYSPTAAQVASVTSWLGQQGFSVGTVSPDRLRIDVSGTAAQVEQAFSTTLSYHVVNGHTLRLADSNLSVPSSLAGIVSGAPGLSESLATPAVSNGASVGGGPSQPGATTTTVPNDDNAAAVPGNGPSPYPPPSGFKPAPPCGLYYNQKYDTAQPPYGNGYPYPAPYEVCGYVPQLFQSAYGLSSQIVAGRTGQGQTVAIVDAYASPTLLSDVQRFYREVDPSQPLTKGQFSALYPSSYNHAALCSANGWYTEQTLDVTAVHATAPGAHILYVAAPNCINGLFDAVAAVVDHHLANVVTDSWGDTGGDLLDPPATRASFDNVLTMAAGTGVSVLFSSGDDGDNFPVLGVTAPDYPASSPYATGVGGTTLQIGSAGQRLGELGWSTYHSYLCNAVLFGSPGCSPATRGTWLPLSFDGASGGGTSYNYAQPWYQAGIVPTSMSEANAPLVGPAPTRVVPDISMDADPSTGILMGQTQTFPNGTYWSLTRYGGTSLASPLFAGVLALADQQAGISLGFVNPDLYKLAASGSSAIYDVVPGGQQDQARVDFANLFDASAGRLFSTRVITYEGTETYCNGAGNCASRPNTLVTAPGYDNMTGLGTPGDGFVAALSKL